MSDVWPPPPENQPNRAASAPSLRHRFAAIVSSGLLYSCVGTLMLLAPVLVVARRGFSLLYLFADANLFFGDLALFGLTFVIVGGSLGCAARRTANGLTVLIVSSAALCLSLGLVLMRSL